MNTLNIIQISLKEINPPIIHSHPFQPHAIKHILKLLNFKYHELTNVYVKEFESKFSATNGKITVSVPVDITMIYNENKKEEKFSIYYGTELLHSTDDAELFISEAFNLTEHEN